MTLQGMAENTDFGKSMGLIHCSTNQNQEKMFNLIQKVVTLDTFSFKYIQANLLAPNLCIVKVTNTNHVSVIQLGNSYMKLLRLYSMKPTICHSCILHLRNIKI